MQPAIAGYLLFLLTPFPWSIRQGDLILMLMAYLGILMKWLLTLSQESNKRGLISSWPYILRTQKQQAFHGMRLKWNPVESLCAPRWGIVQKKTVWTGSNLSVLSVIQRVQSNCPKDQNLSLLCDSQSPSRESSSACQHTNNLTSRVAVYGFSFFGARSNQQ